MSQIPLIDFEAYSLGRDQPDRSKLEKLVSDIDAAFKSDGIALIINHGIRKDQIELAFRHFEDFVKLPAETKGKYAREEGMIHGYLGKETETLSLKGRPLPDYKEAYNYYPPMGKHLVFDKEVPGAGDHMFMIWNEMRKLFMRFLELVSMAAKFDFATIRDLHRGLTGESSSTPNNSTLRYLFYPALEDGKPPKDQQVRFSEHTDYGTISFVATSDVGGFEFQSRSGEWMPVPPHPDALIVLCSNCLERFTADRYRAVLHRGVFVDGNDSYTDRLALAFFGTPDDAAKVGCLDGNPKYEAVTYETYLKQLFFEKFEGY